MVEAHHRWYEDIAKIINSYQDSLTKKDQKKYKLDLLLRIARRIADFSAKCGECQLFQQEITTLTQDLGNIVHMPKPVSKKARQNYFKTINHIIKHLKKQHKLVTEKQNIGIWSGIGIAIGTAIGAALENPGIGTAIGVGIGLAIGSYLDRKAKEEGRVI